ncbi:hypothetical protein NQ315_010932, partial [Exocentrus adspersus]
THYDCSLLDFGAYDFIIIGAGSSGAVIANRLSEVENWNILVLEAGTLPNNSTEIPALYAFGCFSDFNWGFKTVPQTTACLGTVEQRCMVPRGRGLGGTTLINGLIYSRGHPADYDRWADLLNDSSWSYDNVLPYFKKSEDLHVTDEEAPLDYQYHSSGGFWSVEHHKPSIQIEYVFLEANKELGYNLTDYNSRDRSGGTVIQYNTKQGKRHDQGQTYRATAGKEVVLSAGVISSPQILMLSGLGPQHHLEELGIPVIKNLSVGASLKDHIGVFGLQFSSNMSLPNSTLREQVEEYLKGVGPLTSNALSHVLGWYRTNGTPTSGSPDIELVVDVTSSNSEFAQRFLGWNDETWDALWRDNPASFYLNPLFLHPRSVGTVKLKSSSPFDFPLIDYNLLSDPEDKDIDGLYEGINLIFQLVNTTAFQNIEAKPELRQLPACSTYEFLSKDYWYCYIRRLGLPVFHAVGTCAMGTDPSAGAVVDPEFKVFGIRNLRVADSSVFPFTLSSHPSADCAMIGEKVSDVIKLVHL